MILLDTHVWFWWVSSPKLLTSGQRSLLERTSEPLAVSIISLWEVAMLHSKNRIALPCSLDLWFEKALEESGIETIDLSRAIIIESNHLPGRFHSDPADRIIVASSRVIGSPLLTSDKKIIEYAHVITIP